MVWTTLVADLETPVSAFLKAGADRPLSFLLESVEGGAARGRYSIIGLDPDVVWRARGGVAEINRNAGAEPGCFVPCPEPPLARAARLHQGKPVRSARQPAADGGRACSAISATTWCG